MITFLDGKLVNALPTQATIDVGGVGYEVFIPLSSYDKLPTAGQPIRILTHLAVREDAHVLYGFMTPAERDQYCLDAGSKAPLLGIPSHMLPSTTAALGAYMERMLVGGDIVVTGTARAIAADILSFGLRGPARPRAHGGYGPLLRG